MSPQLDCEEETVGGGEQSEEQEESSAHKTSLLCPVSAGLFARLDGVHDLVTSRSPLLLGFE